MDELRIDKNKLYTANARSITRMGHRESQLAHSWSRSCREPAPPKILTGATALGSLFSVPAATSPVRLYSKDPAKYPAINITMLIVIALFLPTPLCMKTRQSFPPSPRG